MITDEEEFREWDGVEEDWQEFNKKKNEGKPIINGRKKEKNSSNSN